MALALNASGESLVKHGGASRLRVVDKGFIQSPSGFGFPLYQLLIGSLPEGYMRPIPCVHGVFKVIALSVHPAVWCLVRFSFFDLFSALMCFVFRAGLGLDGGGLFNASLKMQSTFFLSKV